MQPLRLVLASQSPRRRELLERAGFSFTVSPTQLSEILNDSLSLTARIEDLARRKAEAWVELAKTTNTQDILVLAADTVVALGDQILGKPKDQNENLSFLRQLSGHNHQVITAVCLVEPATGKTLVSHGLSVIRFRSLAEDEMLAYASSGDGLDKAGGYGIQGPAGKFVETMTGDFDNVMGLPIAVVEELLRVGGWKLDRGDSIGQKLNAVRSRVSAACARAGRAESTVRVVAVSKTKPAEMISAAIAAGQKLFGENYVQEALGKMAGFPSAEWHFIGSLQSNKAKSVAGKFALVHSVDRVKLASTLDLAARELGVRQPVLLQIHIGAEATKQGFDLAEAPAALAEISAMKNLNVQGLMSLPPLEESEILARANFALLRNLLETLRETLPVEQRAGFRELSMGTSSDFEAAILEGATLVRIGTDIFGARE